MGTKNDDPVKEVLDKFWDQVKPEGRMDLIISLDPLKETIDVRPAIVYEMSPDRLILSQTRPPLNHSMVGKEIGATFVVVDKPGKIAKRWGYGTKIKEMMPAYQARGQEEPTQALVIEPPGPLLTETDLRFHHRLKILPEYETSIQIPALGKPVLLIKLSFGGALVSLGGITSVSEGQILSFQLSFHDHSTVRGEAEIRNLSWKKGRECTFIGLRFLPLETNEGRHLERMVNRLLRLERESVFLGKKE